MKESDDDDRIIALPISLWSGYTYGRVAFGGGLNSNLFLYSVALFADIYPDPKGGFTSCPRWVGACCFLPQIPQWARSRRWRRL